MKVSLGNNNPVLQSKISQEITSERANIKGDKTNNVRNKTDSNEISNTRNKALEDNRLLAAKSSILYDVTVKESSRLSDLKESIKNGSYRVPTKELVQAMLA